MSSCGLNKSCNFSTNKHFVKKNGVFRWCTPSIEKTLSEFKRVKKGHIAATGISKLNFKSRLVAAGLFNPKSNPICVEKKLKKEFNDFYRWSFQIIHSDICK